MKVGDQIVEVNGEDCKDVQDITKIVALKSVIQQTDIKEVNTAHNYTLNLHLTT